MDARLVALRQSAADDFPPGSRRKTFFNDHFVQFSAPLWLGHGRVARRNLPFSLSPPLHRSRGRQTFSVGCLASCCAPANGGAAVWPAVPKSAFWAGNHRLKSGSSCSFRTIPALNVQLGRFCLRQDKPWKRGGNTDLKPFVAIQRVDALPVEAQPASRKQVLHGRRRRRS
jgi:hypothetical protein